MLPASRDVRPFAAHARAMPPVFSWRVDSCWRCPAIVRAPHVVRGLARAVRSRSSARGAGSRYDGAMPGTLPLGADVDDDQRPTVAMEGPARPATALLGRLISGR